MKKISVGTAIVILGVAVGLWLILSGVRDVEYGACGFGQVERGGTCE